MHTWTPRPLSEVPDERLYPAWVWWQGVRVKTLEVGSRCTPYAVGKQMAAERGWTSGEFLAADSIIRRESSWDPCAHYPGVHGDCGYLGESACGIPQAVPCSKLRDACGSITYGTLRCQIAWTYNYMDGRYGGPYGALAHKNAYGWY